MMNKSPLIQFDTVSMHFGGIKAVDDVSFCVYPGQIFGIIGPNGAGKTTIFNVLSGVYVPSKGVVYADGKPVNNLPPHKIIGTMVGRTFQNIRLFNDLTVLDNLKIAQYCKIQYTLKDALLVTKKFKEEEERIEAESIEVLKFLDLSDKAHIIAGTLPYGAQRRVEIARALVSKPKVLLLDEPAAGMNGSEIDELNMFISKIRSDFNLTVLLVEHQMKLVMNVCDEILVLNFGKKLVIGKPEEIRTNKQVLEAYLGKARKHG
jgi:branched-chain amino acid transport system ATP-binding protein